MNQDDIDIFNEAKKLSLVSFLEAQMSETGKKVSKTIRFKSCPACGVGLQLRCAVTNDLVWHCFSCGKGGSIIDAASFLWGVNSVEAAKSLLGISDEVRVVNIKERDTNLKPDVDGSISSEHKAAFFKSLREKIRGNIDSNVMKYLTEERLIPREIVLKAMERGMLGMMPSDPKKAFEIIKSAATRESLELADIWKKDTKMPGICFRPLVFFLPGAYSAEFRIIRPPRDKDEAKSIRYNTSSKPFFWRGDGSSISNRTLVLEGFIDLLSALVLGWKEDIMALPGTQSYKAYGLEWFFECKRVHETDLFVIGFDNDEGREDGKNPGQTAAIELVNSLTEAGLPCINKPPKANDINAFLKQKMRLRLVA